MKNLFVTTAFACLATSGLLGRESGDWRFEIGIEYVSGLSELADAYEKALEEDGYTTTDSTEIPLGLTFETGMDWDLGAGWLGWTFSYGPTILVLSDVSTEYIVPLGMGLRYSYALTDSLFIYVTPEARYAFAGREYVSGGGFGFRGTAGMEYFFNPGFGIGLSSFYDSTTIEIDYPSGGSEDIQPYQWGIAFYLTF